MLKGRDVTIEFKDGADIGGRDVLLAGDSLSWVSPRTGVESRTCVCRVDKIVDRSHLRGALEGFGFGLGGGASVGYIIARANTSDRHSELEGFGGLVIFGSSALVGSIVGVIVGAAVGHRSNIEFDAVRQTDTTGTKGKKGR